MYLIFNKLKYIIQIFVICLLYNSILCVSISLQNNLDLDTGENHRDNNILKDALKYFNEYPNEKMWNNIHTINSTNPLIFFHQRKAGGSSIRLDLTKFANKINKSYYIPCHNGTLCDIYNIINGKDIYGGHFRWGIQNNFERLHIGGRNEFNCFTNMREPTDRIMSCLFYRFATASRKYKCIKDMPLDEFEHLLTRIDEYGTSCLNEPFRVLSGIDDEELLDHLQFNRRKLRGNSNIDIDITTATTTTTTTNVVTGSNNNHIYGSETNTNANTNTNTSRSLFGPMAGVMFNLTLQHINRCPPVILSLPQTFKLQGMRFTEILKNEFNPDGTDGPVDINFDIFPIGVHTNTGDHKNDCGWEHNDAHLKLIEKYASLEIILYEAVYNKVKNYLDIVLPQ